MTEKPDTKHTKSMVKLGVAFYSVNFTDFLDQKSFFQVLTSWIPFTQSLL